MQQTGIAHATRPTQSTRIERLGRWAVALILAEMVAIGVAKAYYKPLWLDEIMGVLIAKLPTISRIVAICQSGADNEPIAYHLLMRASVWFFGNDALGLRVPSVLGYALCCFFLYRFTSRRTGPLYGVIAMLLPLLMGSWYYATEGRSYALMLACAAAAAVCWQSVAANRRRSLPVLALALVLICALNLHYYSVLLFVPLWIAESVWSYVHRRLDGRVWLALTIPLVALLPYVPVIRVSKLNSGLPNAFFAKPSLSNSLWEFAGYFFSPMILAVFSAGIVYFLFECFGPAARPEEALTRQDKRSIRLDAIVALGFACIPVFALVLSRFGTHVFFLRYGIAASFGVAGLFAFCAWLAFDGRNGPALATICMLVILIVREQAKQDWNIIRNGRNTPLAQQIVAQIPELARNGVKPIVAANPDGFMQYFYYGDEGLRNRLFYLASEPLAEHYLGFTFLERMMLGSAPFFRTHVVDYSTFTRNNRSFYVIGGMLPSDWLIPKLLDDQVSLQLLQGGPSNVFGDSYVPCFQAEVSAIELSLSRGLMPTGASI
jgi:hypothetical protein